MAANMNVAFNAPCRENELLRDYFNKAINDVLDSGYYLLGSQVKAFENEFASFCSSEYCITVGNGTDALEIALRSLGVKSGDEVITVANAGGYSTSACNIIGAVPVYVDVNRSNLLLDVQQALEAVSYATKCVIATHLYGQVVDIHQLRKLLDSAGYEHVKILEDCAQAHGATLQGQPVGSLADIATFSFYPTKNLGALGDGGAIITSDAALMHTCLQLRQYGWNSKYESSITYGRNSRMDEIQAAILRVKLKQLPELNAKRYFACEFLYQACRHHVNVVTIPTSGHVGHLFVVRHPRRDAIREELRKQGIASDIHYPVLDMDQISMHHQPFRSLKVGWSRQASQEIFSLPCYAGIEQPELDYIKLVFDKHVPKVVNG